MRRWRRRRPPVIPPVVPPAVPSPVLHQETRKTPEGAVIDVDTYGDFTAQSVYETLVRNAVDLDKIGPTYTIKVQDVYPSQTVSSAGGLGGFAAVTYLKGVGSTWVTEPEAILAHEFGAAWMGYWWATKHNQDWSSYLQARGLLGDARVDTTYAWSTLEMTAEDYRLLFGSPVAVSTAPHVINLEIPNPQDVPGLADFLIGPWRGA